MRGRKIDLSKIGRGPRRVLQVMRSNPPANTNGDLTPNLTGVLLDHGLIELVPDNRAKAKYRYMAKVTPRGYKALKLIDLEMA